MILTKPMGLSRLSSSLVAGLSMVALASSLVACVIDDTSSRRSDTPTYADPGGTGSIGGTPSDDPGTSPAPVLVVVDTDQVMNADPGQGVGIFTEYAAGGKWHVWWTCDTAMSGQDCDVALSATAASGTITNLDATALQGGSVVTTNPSRVDVRITTSTQVHGITFSTDPGAVITLEATIGGMKEGPGPNGSFFFFVQDGKINGGFTGHLTNPLQLQGKTP
jgi:hypothetical protein